MSKEKLLNIDFTKSFSKTEYEFVNVCHTWTIERFWELWQMFKVKTFETNLFNDNHPKMKFVITLTMEYNNWAVYVIPRCDVSLQQYTYIVGLSVLNIDSELKTETLNNQTKFSFSADEFKITQTLPHDNLTISCKICVALLPKVKDIPLYMIEVPKCKLAEHFSALLNAKEFADVTIVTGEDYKIPAHKAILSARSKVFAAMFRQPMQESQQNCVTISEFYKEVVLELLRFIYTGKAANVEALAEDLLAAADKYDLEGLRALCLKSLGDNLSIGSAALTFKLADLYNEKELKLQSVRFIKYNEENVIKTESWKNIILTDVNLIQEFFESAAVLDKQKK